MGKGKWLGIGAAVAGIMAAGLWARRERRLRALRASNVSIRVLVVGAGVVGSAYAAHLARWGMEVTLLARGERLKQLEQRGLRVQDALSRAQHLAPVRLVAVAPAEEEYDLILVAVRYTQALAALDSLRSLAHTTPVLVLQNNPSGAEQLAAALDERHLLMGFPGTGGARLEEGVSALPLWLGTTVIGESDGLSTPRLRQAAVILRRAGIRVEVERRIVPWLRTHAALMAVLAACVYRNHGHMAELVRQPGELRLYQGALREAYELLERAGIPVTPRAELSVFLRPGRLQRAYLRLAGILPWAGLLVDRHLAAAPEEMKACYDELMSLVAQTGFSAPLLRSLAPYFAT